MITSIRGGGIHGKQAADYGVNDKSGVGAITQDVSGELTPARAVDMPADVTYGAGGPTLEAAFIADGACILDSHV